MKTFKASQLSNNPAPIFAAAREEGAIIQQCRTNGEVIEEFVLLPVKPDLISAAENVISLESGLSEHMNRNAGIFNALEDLKPLADKLIKEAIERGTIPTKER